jgi:hypothetical protein
MQDSPERVGISRQKLMKALLVPERLWLLERCQRADERLTVETLSDELAAAVHATPPTQEQRYRQYVSLVHVHLPDLDGLGLVVYDDETETVTASAQLAEFDEAIRLGRELVAELGSVTPVATVPST